MNPLRGLIMAISRIPPAAQLLAIISIAVSVTLLVNAQVNIKQREYDEKIKMAEDKLKGVDARVVMIAEDIPEGTVISSSKLEEKEINSNRLPADAITSTAMASGRMAKYHLAKGQILSQHDLAPIGISLSFESRLPKGMRAVTFAVDTNSGVAGFITPDSSVDVMSMVGSGAETQVAPILSDVKVIAVGQTYERSSGKTQAIPTNSVTVAVAPEDAQKLVKGIAASKLYLSLRNKDDHVPVTTVDVTALFPAKLASGEDSNLMASNADKLDFQLPPPPSVGQLDNTTFNQDPEIGTPGAPPAPSHIIEMWSGEQKSTLELTPSN